jgi:tripartite ATP-independent transporter DctP family solute receptor
MTVASSTTWAAPKEVRIASHVSELSPLHAQSVLFAKTVEERLPGHFTFEIFPNGQLGKENALLDNLQLGTLEMVNVASGVMKLDGKLGLFDLPWLFDDRAHVQRAMAAGLEDAVRGQIETVAPIKVVGVYENGFRHVINSKKPIVEPADIEGLKVRISGGKFRQDVFASMGAIPTKVSWGETFTAMQVGVVDGAEAAIYGFYEQKMHEVQDYLSLTGHVYTPSFLLASDSFWTGLTDEERTVLAEVGRGITDQTYADAATLEKKYLDVMGQSLKVNAIDLKAFQEKVKGVSASYTADYGDDWLAIVEKTRQ